MNPDPLSKNTDGHTEMASSGRIPEGLYPFQHDPNITEGSEFLDDAIRTKDQPLYETIEREINKPS
jgi:hypothetical protein